MPSFISPLEEWLDRQIDRRLVRTLFLALVAIVRLRHSRSGLLLSELGAHILSPAQAPAGTKRLSNLLRSPKWSHTLLEKFLWQRAEQCLTRLEQQGRTALAIWDESVLEKPESIADSSIRRGCARSAPARRHASSASSRATTILPVGRRCSCPACSGSPSWWPGCRGLPAWPPCAGGPAGAIWPVAGRNRQRRCSPSALKAGRSGWSTSSTGDMPGHPGSGSWAYIKPGSSCAGPPAIAWPTGRASVPPGRSPGANAPKAIARSGTLAAVNIARPASWRSRYEPVSHPQADGELWLVVSRPGKGRTPWYLLTNEPIATNDDAWRVVLAYARRWQVELCYRACKTDLAMESPRLWFWANRLKLLLMVTLVYAFLLSLLAPELKSLVQDLLRGWCHRTGERYRQAAIPLSRLRAALSALWLSYPPKLTSA